MQREIETLHYFFKDLLTSQKETNSVQVSAIGISNQIASIPKHAGKTRIPIETKTKALKAEIIIEIFALPIAVK